MGTLPIHGTVTDLRDQRMVEPNRPVVSERSHWPGTLPGYGFVTEEPRKGVGQRCPYSVLSS
jgi:hypothetical protein